MAAQTAKKRRLLSLTLAWSVCYVLRTASKKPIKTPDCNEDAANALTHTPWERGAHAESKLVVVRGHIEHLLSTSKPLRNQLVLELPTLQAFRSGEISSFHIEWTDLESGDLQVLDSKDLQFYTLPLHPTVAKHIDQYVRETGVSEGFLIRSLPGAPHTSRRSAGKSRGFGMSISNIEWIWKKECLRADVPIMSPRMGRAYFAAVWHFVEHKSMYHLMAMLRHSNIRVTEDYLEKLVDYEDLKAEFHRGTFSSFLSLCTRSDSCPLSSPGCRCRMFQPQVTAEVKTQA